MTSFRDAATMRVMWIPTGTAITAQYPTGAALGALKDGTPPTPTRIDIGDTLTGTASASAFPIGTKRMANVHSIHIKKTGGAHNVKLVSAQNTAEILTFDLNAGSTDVHSFSEGFICPGGFAVVRSDTSVECYVVYDLLEN
jgi:hypothetical protein